MRRIAIVVGVLFSAGAAAREVPPLTLSGDIVPAHDPAVIRAGGVYYAYSTGQRGRVPLVARMSHDLRHWRALPSPLSAIPDWARAAVPGATTLWAPDIARVGTRYRLYYSVSTFGSRRSAIGLATAATLDPAARDRGWRDEGMVIGSDDTRDYNAIDPAFFVDRRQRHWLAFGSFWGGLKLVRLNPETGKPAEPSAEPLPIARRPAGAGRAIEAPFLLDHGGWYWLIAAFDRCCRGAESDYHLVVGRSRAVTGPYVDRAGTPMLDGGGTVLLRAAPGDRFRGPGHAAVLHDGGRYYLVHHAYDADARGAPTLRIARLAWDRDGWPVVQR